MLGRPPPGALGVGHVQEVEAGGHHTPLTLLSSLPGQERWQQDTGAVATSSTRSQGERGGCLDPHQKGTRLPRTSHPSAGQGTGTQNNSEAVPHTSRREPAPYLAAHLLGSCCQQKAGKAPNPRSPWLRPAPSPCQRHGQGHPSPQRAAKPHSPISPPFPLGSSVQPAGGEAPSRRGFAPLLPFEPPREHNQPLRDLTKRSRLRDAVAQRRGPTFILISLANFSSSFLTSVRIILETLRTSCFHSMG